MLNADSVFKVVSNRMGAETGSVLYPKGPWFHPSDTEWSADPDGDPIKTNEDISHAIVAFGFTQQEAVDLLAEMLDDEITRANADGQRYFWRRMPEVVEDKDLKSGVTRYKASLRLTVLEEE